MSTAAPKVYAAINAVANLLSQIGIAKAQENTHQRFMFRGIDDVYSALARPLVDCGLRIFPRVIARETTERETKQGGTAFATVLTVEYDFVSTEDGSKHTAVVVGEAADSGDKGHSKALSMAFKYACFQVFCIPVEGEEDADATTHELKGTKQNSRAGGEQSRVSTGQQAGASTPPAEESPALKLIRSEVAKYGENAKLVEGKINEAMGVKALADIPEAKLPEALTKLLAYNAAIKAAAEKRAATSQAPSEPAKPAPRGTRKPAAKSDLPV